MPIATKKLINYTKIPICICTDIVSNWCELKKEYWFHVEFRHRYQTLSVAGDYVKDDISMTFTSVIHVTEIVCTCSQSNMNLPKLHTS